MAYRREYIGRMHPEYTGSGKTEVLVYDEGNEIVGHFTGDDARADATKFLQAHNQPDNVITLAGRFR